MTDKAKRYLDKMKITAIGTLKWNEYNGIKNPQMIIGKTRELLRIKQEARVQKNI